LTALSLCKPLAYHGRCTNIRAAAQPKSQAASSETRRPSQQPRRIGDGRFSPKPCEQQIRPIKLLPTMDSEAAASTHNHQSGPLPQHPPTQRKRSHTQPPKLTLQGAAHKREVTMASPSPAPANQSLGFHPKRPSHTHRKRKQAPR
jgi:hypothetical protein